MQAPSTDGAATWGKRFAGACLVLWWVLGVPPTSADSVYLTNGEVYEDVVAEVGESQVRVHLPFGAVSLSRSQIERVEKAETPLEKFLRRSEALEDDPGITPEDWLDLARWARRAGLPYGSRNAALAAAELDPDVDGVAAILRSFGYRREKHTGRWAPRPRQRQEAPRAAAESLALDELRASLDRRRREDEDSQRCCTGTPAQVEIKVVAAPQPTYGWPPVHYPFVGAVVMGTGGWDRLTTRVPGSPLPIGKP